MSNSAHDNKQYSLEDIRNYFQGRMSSMEMHALEKAALNDPFLADAMEGVEAGMRKDPDAFKTDIDDIRQRLNRRTRRKSLVAWWTVAAAVLIIVAGAGVLTFFFNQPSEDKTVASVEQRSVSPSPTEKQAETLDTADSNTRKDVAGVAKNIPKAQRPRPKFEDLSAASKAVIDSPQSAFSKPTFSEDTIKQGEYELAKQVSPPALQKQEKITREISGKVAGVAIDSTTMLNDVVVVGYGVKKKRTERYETVASRNQKNIVPDGGWAKFDQYVQNNKRIEGNDAHLTGKEVIAFTIDPNGRPVDMKIRKSLSGQHDAEAIRLLQEGPAWQVLKGNRRKVRLTILF